MFGVHYQLHTHHGGVSKVWQKTTPGGIFYGALFQNKHPSAWKEPLSGVQWLS